MQMHVIQYVDKRMVELAKQFEASLDKHTEEEIARYKEITEKLDRNYEASVKRHELLFGQLTTSCARTEKIEAAFLAHEDGGRDFEGHMAYHRNKKKFGDMLESFKWVAAKELAKVALIGGLGWFLGDLIMHVRGMH